MATQQDHDREYAEFQLCCLNAGLAKKASPEIIQERLVAMLNSRNPCALKALEVAKQTYRTQGWKPNSIFDGTGYQRLMGKDL